MSSPLSLPPYLQEQLLWEQENNPLWPASTFILRRNLAKFPFPSKLDENSMRQVEGILATALTSISHLDTPTFLKAEELSALDKEFLYEHFLCRESFQNMSKGQAFVVDRSSRFLALINSEDHLQLHLVDSKGDWEKAWAFLSEIDTALSSSLEFAFSPRFGYQTSDLGFLGTGLEIFCYLNLPALIHTKELEETLLKQKEEGIDAGGILGTPEDLVGDLVVLNNRYTLGVSEDHILHALHSTSSKLILAEKAVRDHLKQEASVDMKDHVARAFGLLVHSYQLQAKEAMNALSMLKFGLDLGWVEGISLQKIRELFFNCQHAHLTYALKRQEISHEEVAKKRAEYLHAHIKNIQLKI